MNDLPFEWEAGEIIEQAYVTIDGVKHYVTPATYDGGTALSAFHLNKSEEETLKRTFGKVLWKNDLPTADFPQQNITLSSSDYDMLEVFYRSDLAGNLVFSSRFLKGHGTQMDFFSTGTATLRWSRRMAYVDDTTLNVYNGSQVGESGLRNDQCVPLYIIGYKTGLFGGQA